MFGTLYYVIDKQNGHMMGIVNDQLQSIDCGAQLEPFDLGQLSQMITTLEQKGKVLMIPLFQQMMYATTECGTQVHCKILDLLIP